VAQSELSITWQGTFFIAQNVILASINARSAFGAGPNRFLNEWLLFKPATINVVIIGIRDINFGVGIIPSALVTTGILGLLSGLCFLAC